MDALLAMKHDGITHIGGGRFNKSDGTRHKVFIVFESEQVKSAEPITYDDDGKVIPLSKRFNADDPDIRYDKKAPSNKAQSGNFDTSGTHWALKEELIDKKDLAIFYHAIANLSKRGYSYHRTFSGEYIIESGNKMIFTNGDYNRPTISRVITFNDRYENNMAKYKEWIYDAVDQRNSTRLGETLSLIDIYEGEGYVSDRSPESFSKYDRKERAGEGSNRRTDFAGTESEEVKADKKSRLTEGDVFSTEDGKQAYAERYGMQLETEGQAHRAAARDAQRADELLQNRVSGIISA